MAFKQYNGVLWEKLKGGSEEEFAEYMPMDVNAFATKASDSFYFFHTPFLQGK